MTANHYTGIIKRYQTRLPVGANTPILGLGEGNTPLIQLNNIPKIIGTDCEIYVKFEGLNPTGSFKDRGMVMAVSKALEEGSQAIICASTGNTSAAAAAYAARSGIKAFVLIPEGKIALGKLAQAIMHGAEVIQIKGNFDDGMNLVKQLGQSGAKITIVNSINPHRLQGQKTAAFEIVEALGDAPDYHCIPVGNAGNISAYYMGYREYHQDQIASKTPVMCGYQAEGAAPFVHNQIVTNPETVATAIRIGNPQSWDKAWQASRESGGWFAPFSDAQILETQSLLAKKEGVFCEPASAISLAGALADIQSGKIANGSRVVCTLTGNGLKDPDIVISQHDINLNAIEPTQAAVEKAILHQL